METYNKGDVDQFYRDIQTYKTQIESNATLSSNKRVLEDKIKIASFTELVFSLPKNKRTIPFSMIATVTKIPVESIELMILKAMSLELLRGSIDEVAQEVTLTWIQPRVLDKARVVQMKDKFEGWRGNLSGLLGFVLDYKNSLN